MRKARVAALGGILLAAACSGQGEIIPTPSPGPTTGPSTTELIVAAEAPTTTEAVTSTTYLRKPITTTPTPTIPTTTLASPSSLAYGEWAIPEYIVACETGGTFSWTAYNKFSGASGPYQIMPEWFGGELAMNQSRSAQHAMAARIWDGGRGASNWAACL